MKRITRSTTKDRGARYRLVGALVALLPAAWSTGAAAGEAAGRPAAAAVAEAAAARDCAALPRLGAGEFRPECEADWRGYGRDASAALNRALGNARAHGGRGTVLLTAGRVYSYGGGGPVVLYSAGPDGRATVRAQGEGPRPILRSRHIGSQLWMNASDTLRSIHFQGPSHGWAPDAWRNRTQGEPAIKCAQHPSLPPHRGCVIEDAVIEGFHGDGVLAAHSVAGTLTRSVVRNNLRSGILLVNTAEWEVSDNVFAQNGQNAVDETNGTGQRILRNRCDASGWEDITGGEGNGIVLNGTQRSRIEANVCRENHRFGIWLVAGASHNRVEQNTLLANRAGGATWNQAGRGAIVIGPGGAASHVNNVIRGNTAQGTAGRGIDWWDGEPGTRSRGTVIADNELGGNRDGCLRPPPRSTVRGNVCEVAAARR
jgi:parallel beta-helix repeat protein